MRNIRHVVLIFVIVSWAVLGCGGRLADGRRCPSGTKLDGAAPPKDFIQRCCRKDSLKAGYCVENGPSISWHPNGQIKEKGQYDNKVGGQTGKWTTWHPNGQKESEGDYSGSVRTGHWTFWWSNGQKKAEGTVKSSGAFNDNWAAWDANGNKANVFDVIRQEE